MRTAPPSALQENELDLYVFDDEEDMDTYIERDGQTAGERHQRNAAMQERGETAVKKRRFTVGLVKDTLTSLPPNFKFPPMICEQLVTNWFCGNVSKNIIPLCRLNSKDMINIKDGNSTRNKMARFVKVVEKYGRAENCWMDRKSEWSPALVLVSKLWNSVGRKRIYAKYNNKNDSRVMSITWKTMHNKMLKKVAFKKKREMCRDDVMWDLSIYNHALPSGVIL